MRDEQLASQTQSLEVLKNVALAYSRIASVRIRRERESVLSNRLFQSEVAAVFKEVLASYARQAKKLLKDRGGEGGVTFLSHNGKTVAVFISANTGLYGDIVQRTFELFRQEIETSSEVEVTIVGRLGRSLYLGLYPDRPYTYFDLPDWEATQEDLAEVVRHIVQYEKIHVYFGRFENIAYQSPDKTEIAAETPLAELGEEKTKFYFEPTLEEILQFFETEIFASVFEQVVRESQLAKFASRMMAMDQASVNIKRRLALMQLEDLRRSHRRENRRQLNSLASIIHSSGYDHGR